jgi:hypothetical protein
MARALSALSANSGLTAAARSTNNITAGFCDSPSRAEGASGPASPTAGTRVPLNVQDGAACHKHLERRAGIHSFVTSGAAPRTCSKLSSSSGVGACSVSASAKGLPPVCRTPKT